MSPSSRVLTALATVLVTASAGSAQPQTIGLFQNDPGSFTGYTLFEGLAYHDTYLIDNEGRLVHSWTSTYNPGNMCYLLDNGNLLRGANPGSPYWSVPGSSGMVQEFDWDGNLIWEFTYSDSNHIHHHDLARLPNGNVLLLAFERKTFFEAVDAGRDPFLLSESDLFPEHIVEVEPVGLNGGNIVWEWHVWDHLIQDFDSTKANYGVVADHPELIDINYTNLGDGQADWLHANAINYHEEFDQIVISVNQFTEFWIIDHSTTTQEAAGHTGGLRGMGGDILYRWGNPQTYDRGSVLDQQLYRQHDVQWIEEGLPGEGNILLFNNGFYRPNQQYSTAEEIQTTADSLGNYPVPPAGQPHGPASPLWVYAATPPESLYAAFISGVQRLPNGNTLICEGAPSGTFWEVDTNDQPVWKYVNPVGPGGPLPQGLPPAGNLAFRMRRYPPDYSGFDGRDLTPGDPIEIDITSIAGGLATVSSFELKQSYPNPARSRTTISFTLRDPGDVSLRVFDVAGRLVATVVDRPLPSGEHRYDWTTGDLASGVYHYRLQVGGESSTRRLVVLR